MEGGSSLRRTCAHRHLLNRITVSVVRPFPGSLGNVVKQFPGSLGDVLEDWKERMQLRKLLVVE